MYKYKEMGSLPNLSAEEFEEARKKFTEDIHAPSQRSVVKAKLATLERALAMCNLEMFPPTPFKIQSIGTVLKAGRYRSAETYLGIYKAEAERRGFGWSDLEVRAARDAKRSCQRGLGGPQRALPLPFRRLGELPGGWEPWVGNGPMGPRNLVVLGAWFMMREVEAANALSKDVTIHISQGKPRVTWSLPASKSDQRATGTTRSHGCSCQEVPLPTCPAHAAWEQTSRLKAKFGARYLELPFFPDLRGGVCSKEAVAATLTEAAVKLGVDFENENGKVTGHTMRVTGAQGLAAGGLDLWAIQLLGRWGSMAVKTYVRDAHLEQAEMWARKVGQHKDLEDMITEIVEKVECKLKGQDRWRATVCAAKSVVEDAKADTEATAESTVEEVAEALAVEAMAQQEAETEKEEAVVSEKGIVHAILLGPPSVPAVLAVTSCGWKFGRSSGTFLAKKCELSDSYKAFCAKCFPKERERAKERLKHLAESL